MADIDQLIDPDELSGMSRRDRKKQETRWRIYNAAIRLFAKHGYDNVKIDRICDEADVSSALFFHHFSSKSALIYVFLDQLKSRIGTLLAEVPDASSTEKLRLVSREVARSTRGTSAFTPQLLGALTTGEVKLDMEHLDTGVTGTLSGIIRDGQRKGEFSGDWNAEVVTVLLVSSWLMMPLAASSSDWPDQPYERLLDFVLSGLSA